MPAGTPAVPGIIGVPAGVSLFDPDPDSDFDSDYPDFSDQRNCCQLMDGFPVAMKYGFFRSGLP